MNTPAHHELALPSLPKCILIDSSFTSRKTIIKDLQAAKLFTEIIEAQSLFDALKRLSGDVYDACIIGSSVHTPKAIEFSKEIKKIKKCEQTALVLISKGSGTEEEILAATGAHGILTKPYCKEEFINIIVQSVVKANPNCQWIRVLGQPKTEQLSSVPNNNEKINSGSYDEGKSMKGVSDAAALGLSTLVAGVKSGKFAVDQAGDPNRATLLEIHQLVTGLFEDQKKTQKMVDFQQHMHMSLLDWFIDLFALNEEVATKRFSEKLVVFRKQS